MSQLNRAIATVWFLLALTVVVSAVNVSDNFNRTNSTTSLGTSSSGHAWSMAIAFDAATNGGTGGGATHTFAHTCTGTDRMLFVGVGLGSIGDVITGVTYAGTAMTLVDKLNADGAGTWIYLFALMAPASGANNVVVSQSASLTIYGMASSYTGVSQTGQPSGSIGKPTGTGTTLAGSTTTVGDNSWSVLMGEAFAGTISAGTNTTSRVLGNYDFLMVADRNAPVTPAGSSTLNINSTASGLMGMIVTSFAPAGGAASAPPRLMMMGVGGDRP